MKVTYHAAERFLQRVLGKMSYSSKDIYSMKVYLELTMFRNIVPLSYSYPFPLPEYKGFSVIHRDNIIITIIPKKWLIYKQTKNLFYRRSK